MAIFVPMHASSNLTPVALHSQDVQPENPTGKTPIVILHGLFGCADNWRSLALRMGQVHPTYIVDQRNHGHSPHAAPWDYAHMAADVKTLIEEQVTTPVHLVGHSMGGKTAMWLAAHHPELIETLKVVDISPAANKRGHDTILAALNAVPIDTLSQRKEAEDILKDKGILEPAIRQFLLKGLYRTDDGFAWRYNLSLITQDYENILQGMEDNPVFDKPTLFMRGGNSPYVQEKDMPLIEELFPSYQLSTLDGAGHWLHAEKPQAFMDSLASFLKTEFPKN